MSEIFGGPSSGGNGRVAANVGRTNTGPVPVSSQPPQQQMTPPAAGTAASVPGIKTPREIMRAREERTRAQQEKEEIDRRQREEERRRSAERRALAAGVAGQPRDSGVVTGVPPSSRAPQAQSRQSGSGNAQTYATPSGQPQVPSSQSYEPGVQSRSRGPSLSQEQPRPVSQRQSVPQQAQQPPRQPAAPIQQTSRAPPTASQQLGRDQQPQQPPQTTSSFPHAFERWETLSSHWEGLTSYWLHRLEANEAELRSQPLAAQMSRQIADLSAAGANLFHAVVELQRLRASSERKFQRWFFDTRAEQERARETQAQLERDLRAEREVTKQLQRGAEDRQERDTRNAERIVAETRRELQIAKDEARRAWEELGRREQEERDRTMSLREGLPTVVGGVQVVPMMAGTGAGSVGQSRAGSAAQSQRTDRDGYEQDPFVESGARQQAYSEVSQRSAGQYQSSVGDSVDSRTYGSSQDRDRRRDVYAGSSSSAAQASGGNQGFYSHPEAFVQGATAPMPPASNGHIAPPAPAAASTGGQPSSRYQRRSAAEEEASSEGADDDQRRSYGYDDEERFASGRRRATTGASAESDELDVREEMERERALAARYGVGPSSTSASAAARYQTSGAASNKDYEYDDYEQHGQGAPAPTTGPGASQPPDYSGAGYGPGWDAMRTHHHPTRLSDVIEEDERSRTSPSRTSQASRGLF